MDQIFDQLMLSIKRLIIKKREEILSPGLESLSWLKICVKRTTFSLKEVEMGDPEMLLASVLSLLITMWILCLACWF